MRLKDCNVDVAAISTAPFSRTEAEEEWVRATDLGMIPQSLFDLYRRANYLSFGTAPQFLADEDNLLFSYFCLTVRGVMTALVDAADHVNEFRQAQSETYYPGKHQDDPTWTKEKSDLSDKRARESFRNLLNSLHIALDAMAEIIGIFAPGKIPGLTVGRAQFSSIENWLNKPPVKLGLIATPQDLYLDEIYKALHPIILAAEPESDWLPYMRLLRNKAAHLGQPLFRQVGLPCKDGKYYSFLPREWPYLWEKHIKPAGTASLPESFPVLLTRTLAHEDVISFASGARMKVISVISLAGTTVCKAYQDFNNFPFNDAVLSEIKQNSKSFRFEHFTNS
jgi:hypothetical protein